MTTITQPLTQQASDEALALAAWIKAEDRDEFDIAVAIDAYCKEQLQQVIEAATTMALPVRLSRMRKSFI